MADFRFVHAADLHLDTPFDGLRRLGAEMPQRLRDASLRAWDNLVAETIRVEAAFLILAGDIYDGPQRGLRAQLRFLDGLRRLGDAGVQVFIVHGNHDPVAEGWSAVRAWPEGVTVFAPHDVAGVPVMRDGRRLATVHGISYAERETRANLAKLFPARTAAEFSVGVLHCNLGGNPEHGAYSPCDLDDLRAADIDYWALGHIHRHDVVSRDHPWAVYAGALQGRSPKASETGAKGAVVVEVADDRVVDLAFRPLDVVRFENLTCDIADIPDLPGLREALAAQAGDAVAAADGRELILRATLTGRGPVHQELRRGSDALDALIEELHAGADGRAQVHWDRLIDRTAPAIDKDAIRRRGDFSSELLARAERLAGDRDVLADYVQTHAWPNDRRLRGLVSEAAPEAAEDLLAAAVDEALDRLEPEE